MKGSGAKEQILIFSIEKILTKDNLQVSDDKREDQGSVFFWLSGSYWEHVGLLLVLCSLQMRSQLLHSFPSYCLFCYRLYIANVFYRLLFVNCVIYQISSLLIFLHLLYVLLRSCTLTVFTNPCICHVINVTFWLETVWLWKLKFVSLMLCRSVVWSACILNRKAPWLCAFWKNISSFTAAH